MASSTGAALGRMLVVLGFLGCGYYIFATFDKATGGPLLPTVSKYLDAAKAKFELASGIQVPFDKEFYPRVILAAGVFQIFGSLLFLLNIKFGAMLLVTYIGLLTAITNNFWDYPVGSKEYYTEIISFFKNVAIAGGLVHYIATAKGSTLEDRKKKKYD